MESKLRETLSNIEGILDDTHDALAGTFWLNIVQIAILCAIVVILLGLPK